MLRALPPISSPSIWNTGGAANLALRQLGSVAQASCNTLRRREIRDLRRAAEFLGITPLRTAWSMALMAPWTAVCATGTSPSFTERNALFMALLVAVRALPLRL